MFRSIVLALAFVALVYSQQNSITITPLTPGTAKTGTFLPTTQANNYNVDVYSIMIPAGVTNYTMTIQNTGASGSCSYIAFYSRDEAPACHPGVYDDDEFICANGEYEDPYLGSAAEVHTYEIGDDSDIFHFGQNRTIYITVGRDSSSDYTYTCSYSLTVSYPTQCAMGMVGYEDSNSNQGCMAFNELSFGTMTTANYATGADALYRLNVPASTGNIHITGWFNDSSLEFYGKSYATPYYYSGYDCYSSYDYYNSTSMLYYYDMMCNVPRVGDFWFAIQTDSGDTINGMFMAAFKNCNGTMGGYMCNFPVAPLPTTAATQTFTINSNSSLEFSSYSWMYYTFMLPAKTAGPMAITATSATTSGSAYMILRRGGFPDYSQNEGSSEMYSLGTSASTVALNFYDYNVAGKMYLGFGCSGTCTFAVSQNTSAPPPPPPAFTTGMDMTTSVETASSSATFVAISAIVVFVAALF